jgi:hypothetical protein
VPAEDAAARSAATPRALFARIAGGPLFQLAAKVAPATCVRLRFASARASAQCMRSHKPSLMRRLRLCCFSLALRSRPARVVEQFSVIRVRGDGRCMFRSLVRLCSSALAPLPLAHALVCVLTTHRASAPRRWASRR